MTTSAVDQIRMMRRRGARDVRGPRRRTLGIRLESLEARMLLTAVAVDDAYRLIQGQPFQAAPAGVLANDLIASGDPLTVASNTAPAHGVISMSASGSFTYTPTAGYSGPDSFTYVVSDGRGGTDVGTVALDVVRTSASEASIDAGPRLASVDSTRGALLNGVLGGLLGTGLNLDVLDWNALAQGGVSAADFLDALRANLGVGTTAEALTADATLFQVYDAAADAARAEGDTAVADAFDALALDASGLTGTVHAGDLLQVNPNDGSLAGVNLNALDLATGGAQLFNFDNVAATPAPVTISGASLGLGSILNSISLSAQVVEPPVHVVGPEGTTFHTAATRLKLDVDLVDAGLDTSSLIAALAGPLGAALGAGVAVDATAQLGQLSLYVEAASGDGTLSLIDAVSNAVTLQGTPGVADVYLGDLPDALFFDRSYAIDPADVTPELIGNLAVNANLLGDPVLDASTGIMARAVALGQAPLTDTLVYNGPFPQTQTFGSSSTFIANLVDALASNLQLSFSGTLGPVLDPLVNSAILPALTPAVTDAVTPVLGDVLSGVVDPALGSLGVGLGEMDATVAPIIPTVPPQANADFVRTSENAPVVIPVLGNDAAAPAGSASILSATQPAHGTVVVNGDGTIRYTPFANYSGADAFTYTITGPGGGATTATVALQVLAANAPPVAAPDSYATPEDRALTVPGPGVLGNDSDADGNALTAVVLAGPTHGTLALNSNGSFTYTPFPDYNGPDSFTYRAFDGTVYSAPATVAIGVTAVNDAPVANPDAYTTASGQSLVVAGPGVLANDADVDGTPLASFLVTGPAHGTLTFNPNGSFTYTPVAGYSGPDSFVYQATDGSLPSNPATVTITVGVAGSPPVAAADAYAVGEDTPLSVPGPGVLANDVDPDGTPLGAMLVAGPSHGSISFNVDGSFTYIPLPNYSGTDSFTYQAGDGVSFSAPTVVAVRVIAVDDAPVANPDEYQTPPGGVLSVPGPGVLGNDIDIDGPDLGAVLVIGPSHGTVSLDPSGSFVYTPAPGYAGPDQFYYAATDGIQASSPVLVAISVGAAADAAPRVLAVERYGFHTQPTRLVVRFSADLDPASAQDVSHYELFGPGNTRYSIQSATYDPATRSVTLAPSQQLYLYSSYRLLVHDGVTGSSGMALDGDRDGTPGGAAVVMFDKSALAGSYPEPMPSGPVVPLTHRPVLRVPASFVGRPARAAIIGPTLRLAAPQASPWALRTLALQRTLTAPPLPRMR